MTIIDNLIDIVKNKLKLKEKFESIAEEWLQYKKNMIKESTYCNYEFIIQKYLYPKFKNCNIKTIKNYNDFIQELSEKLSPKTVKDIASVLKAILKYYEEEYDENLKIKKISVPKNQKNKLKILTTRERQKLERCCMEENSLKSLGIIVCLNTGLRVGEICALKWENVNLDEKCIYVKKTLQRVYLKNEKKSKIVIDKPKTQNSIRAIPMNKKVYEILKKVKQKHQNSDFVLSGSSESFIEPRNYQYYFKILLKKCKIKQYKFHILRHTFATKCIEVGMDIKSLSEILGHSDINVTLNVYVHSSDKIKKKYLEKL